MDGNYYGFTVFNIANKHTLNVPTQFYSPLSVVAKQGPSLQKRESAKVASYCTLHSLRVTEKVGYLLKVSRLSHGS